MTDSSQEKREGREMKTEKTKMEVREGKKKKLVGTRGRMFQGYVIKKFPGRVVIESERTVRVLKYERFALKKTKLHARIPKGMEVNIGDYIKVQECRPLSKIIKFIVIEIIRRKEE